MSRKYLMSSPQKRLFSIDQMQDPNITYNIPMILKINGRLDIQKLQKCINQMIERHEILRTSFAIIQDKFIQSIESEAECRLSYEEGEEKDLDEVIKAFVRPFDLAKTPLMRAGIYSYGEQQLLLLDFHHIIMDGGSIGIFLNELMQLYDNKELEPLKLQYKDYSAWLRKQNIEKQETYWQKQFAEGIPEAELPLDHARSKKQSFRGASIEMKMGREIKTQIKELSMVHAATDYMVVLAAFMMFMSKYSGKQEVAVGTPVSGRSHPAAQTMLGMFVNTLVLKENVDIEQTFTSLLCQTRDLCLEAFDHQEYEFEALVSKLGIEKAENRNPIFDVMFALQNNEPVEMHFGDLTVEEYPIKSEVAKFDLIFNFGETQDGYVMVWEYNTELFEEATIRRMMHHFNILLEQAVTIPDKIVSKMTCLDTEEYEQILKIFNNPVLDEQENPTIVQLFEETAAQYPDKIAVAYKDKSITYKELNARANGIAAVLMEYGVQRDEFVGIIAEKRIEVIAGLLGILKAGGAYLPLDPANPVNRTKYILKDSKTRVILGCSEENKENYQSAKMINLEKLFEKCFINENQKALNLFSDLAYLIYTSGTTGEPKGTMIEHKSVVRLVRNTNYVSFEDIRILQTGSLTFDASTFEIWGALLNGGFLLLVDSDVMTSSSELKANIDKYKINTMWLTSSLYNQMITMDHTMFDHLRALLIGGEKLSEKHVKLLKDRNTEIDLINGYGPTECTTFALTYKIAHEVPEQIPIGRPIANTTAYIMNGNELCGIGMPGELCLGGTGLARGYLNQEQLTAEKFVENPFETGSKLYRTGDLTRWKETGEVEYLGRIDGQVKIRGFRIGLPEVEKQIMNIAGVKEAVVVVKEKGSDKCLCAYLVGEKEVDLTSVKERLRKQLPEYMIPAAIMKLDKLPVTVNGKIHTRALPDPVMESEGNYTEPQNKVQKDLCEAFQEILEYEKVGIDHSFFELGGDSIKAIRLVSKLRGYGYETSVKVIMDRKTVRMLEHAVTNAQCLTEQEEVYGESKMSPIQNYFFRQNMKYPDHFNQSFMLETDQPIEIENLSKALQVMIQHHDELRAGFHEKKVIHPMKEYGKADLTYYDLTGVEDVFEEMTRIGDREQAQLSIKENKLIKAVVYQTTQKSYLLLIIHHLLVDGVSWRILLEDLGTVYEAILNGAKPNLPKKTMSYKAWTKSLYQVSQSPVIEKEIRYWIEIEKITKKNLLFERTEAIHRKENILSCKIGKEYVQKILYELNGVIEANVLLLLSLTRAIKKMAKVETVSFCMEGHGRHPFDEQMIIDRTVGWFTNMYPICMTGIGHTIIDDIEQVKKILADVPNHGIGYGIIDFYRNELEGVLPEITYNYLGEFAVSEMVNSGFRISEAPVGNEIARENHFGTPVSVNSMIMKKELYINIGYDTSLVKEEFVQELSKLYVQQIKEIVDVCLLEQELFIQQAPNLSGLSKKIRDEYNCKVIEREIVAGTAKYVLLFVENLTDDLYRNIKKIVKGIDFILDMEKLYDAEEEMSVDELRKLCERVSDHQQDLKDDVKNPYWTARCLHRYIPSAIEAMFLRDLKKAWITLSIPVECRTLTKLKTALRRIIKEQTVFRTSARETEGKIVFCEHSYNENIDILVEDVRYLSIEKEEQIRSSVKVFEKNEENGYIPLYVIKILRISEVKYEIFLTISHCIWDKQSQNIFMQFIRTYINDPGDDQLLEEKSNFFACNRIQESAKSVDSEKVSLALGLKTYKTILSKYLEKIKNISIVRYEVALVELNDHMRALYNQNQWNFSTYLAKFIIASNTGIRNGDIPTYLVQENRRYMGAGYQDAIGAYIDLLPLYISMDASLEKTDIEEQLERVGQLKYEKQLSIMEFIHYHKMDISFDMLYALNLQNLFDMSQQQFIEMKHMIKNKSKDSGYEIVVNEYQNNLVFVYPVTDYCHSDISQVLNTVCRELEEHLIQAEEKER